MGAGSLGDAVVHRPDDNAAMLDEPDDGLRGGLEAEGNRARRPQRPRPTPEDRRRVLRTLSLDANQTWRMRFTVMLALSIVVAVSGLLADSPAVVIGAMLIAPLMTPVLGFAVSVAMWWPRRLARSGLTVVVASVGSVALAWLLAMSLPGSGTRLTPELLSRTTPGILDLLVAIAAGAAGAYAIVREDVSASLPGVAVAVALVPPIATVGVTLQLARPELAMGALLLYLTNLVAIVLAGIAVMLLTGFVPLPRLSAVRGRVGLGTSIAFFGVVALAVPLSTGVRHTADDAAVSKAVNDEVLRWLGDDAKLQVHQVSISGSRVTVDVVGSSQPPPTSTLAAALVDTLGEDVSVQVRWSQSSRATAPNGATAAGSSVTADELRPLVRAWLDGAGDRAKTLEVLSLERRDGELMVEVGGPVAPPPVRPLAQAVAARLGTPINVTVDWTVRRQSAASAGVTSSEEGATLRARAAVNAWVRTRPGVQVLAVAVTDGVATVDLAAQDQPDVIGLVDAVKEELSGVKVLVRVADMRPLTAAPTPPTTAP